MNGSYGMNFFVHIEEMGPLPDFEIEEIRFCEALPENLGYGDIYYKMYDEWDALKDKDGLTRYRVNYNEPSHTYAF